MSTPAIHSISNTFNPSPSTIIQISKTLSYYLRHNLEQFKSLRQEYILVEELLHKLRPQFKDITVETIKYIVDNNDKKRYKLAVFDKQLYICAVQGHHMKYKEIVKDIGEIVDIDWCIHGTYTGENNEIMNSILQHGLCVQNRAQIHFATGVTQSIYQKLTKFNKLQDLLKLINCTELPIIKSGARTDTNLLLIINCKQAREDGIIFRCAENGVILSEGKDGVLDAKYFAGVIVLK